MAFESVNYQCPACGGPLHFASAEQKLVCDYCDSRFEVEEVEALYRERQDKADAKADAAAAAPKPAADDAVQELAQNAGTSARRAVPSSCPTAPSPLPPVHTAATLPWHPASSLATSRPTW